MFFFVVSFICLFICLLFLFCISIKTKDNLSNLWPYYIQDSNYKTNVTDSGRACVKLNSIILYYREWFVFHQTVGKTGENVLQGAGLLQSLMNKLKVDRLCVCVSTSERWTTEETLSFVLVSMTKSTHKVRYNLYFLIRCIQNRD